jgi:hypothetical protein
MIRAVALALVIGGISTTASAQQVSSATGALMRGLDKVSGEIVDMEIAAGGSTVFGDLRVSLTECRYPADNPAGEGFAFVQVQKISASAGQAPLFGGWMMASAPALNALDHPRYDVWVLRCKTPAAE